MVAVVLREAFIQKSPYPPLVEIHSGEATADPAARPPRRRRNGARDDALLDEELVEICSGEATAHPAARPPRRRRGGTRVDALLDGERVEICSGEATAHPAARPPRRRRGGARDDALLDGELVEIYSGGATAVQAARQQLTGISSRVAIRWIGRVRAGSAPRTSPVTCVNPRRSRCYICCASRVPSRDRLLLCSYPRRQIRDAIPEAASSVNSQRSPDADRPLDRQFQLRLCIACRCFILQ